MPNPTATVRPFDPTSLIPDGREYCWSQDGSDYQGESSCPYDALVNAVECLDDATKHIRIGYAQPAEWPVTHHASALLEALLDDALGLTGNAGQASIARITIPSSHEIMEASGYTCLFGMAAGCGHLPARFGYWIIPKMQEDALSDEPDCAEGWLESVTDEEQGALDRDLSRILSAWCRENPAAGPLAAWEWPAEVVADLDHRIAVGLTDWLRRINHAPTWQVVPESVEIRRTDAVLAVHVPGQQVERDPSRWGYERWQANPWEGDANRDAID